MIQFAKKIVTYWLRSCFRTNNNILKLHKSSSSTLNQNTSKAKKNFKKSNYKISHNKRDDVKIKEDLCKSFESSSNYIEYCEKTMLVADSGHHTKTTAYPISIHSRKCSSSSIISLSPSQSSIVSAKKTAAISLNNSLKKLPPISSFFNRNLLQKQNSIESEAAATVSLTSAKPSTERKYEDKNLLQKVVTNKTATLVIPSFRTQHHEQLIAEYSASCNNKQKSNELLRRLAQPNTITPTISHRIPNSDSASNDSLNLEMCYFKPIKPVPITPKKGNLVIKRPLPKRIKPKRRKCDVFIGPKKGQMPILFSTLTAFKRCSAFYSNNETTALKSGSVIPELDLYPLVENAKKSKDNIKEKQINNFPQKPTKEYKKPFYVKKCHVFIKRSELITCSKIKSEFRAKSRGGSNKILKKKDNANNFKSNSYRFGDFKSSSTEKSVEPINDTRVFNLRNRNATIKNKNITDIVNETVLLDEDKIKTGSISRRGRSVNTTCTRSSKYKLRTDNAKELNVGRNDIKSKFENTKTTNVCNNANKNLIQYPFGNCENNNNLVGQNKSKPSRTQRLKPDNSQKNLKVNSLYPKRKDVLAQDFDVNCRSLKNKNEGDTFVEENNLSDFGISKTKRKDAKKEVIADLNLNTSNSKLKETKHRKRNFKETDIIEKSELENDIHNSKKQKIDPNETELQRITRSKEKVDLLKADYEFALKLQLEFEAEIFPVEPVANRTRNTISRMNLTCNESDNSSSIPEISSKQTCPNYNEKDNEQTSQPKFNNKSEVIDKNFNDSINQKLENSSKTNNKTNINSKQKFKLGKTGKKNLKEGNSKSVRRLFVPLKG